MFSGIKAREIKDHPGDVYRGAPCLYKKHSGASGSAHSWRTSDTHACLECVEEVKAGHFSLDLGQFTNEALPYVKRFWKSVDIENWDNCWPWTGKVSKTRHLFFMWPRPEILASYKHHPIRVLNWVTRGDIGISGIKSICGERRCANPLHQIPDFMDKSNISPAVFQKERDNLINQLYEFSKPEYVAEPPDMYFESQMEVAYERMLNYYDKKLCQTNDKIVERL